LEEVTLLTSLSGTASVLAIALLDEQLFVTRLNSAKVSVYNCESLNWLKDLTFSGLGTWLFGLATSPIDNYLFISDWNNNCIHRVNLSAPTVSILTWTVAAGYLRAMSITSNGNLLVVFNYHNIGEYTPDGTFVRQITDVYTLWHAVQVNNDVWAYVVLDEMNGVRTAFTNGTMIKRYGFTAGAAITQMDSPRNLALDAHGYIFVSDLNNNRILIVDPSLTEARQLTLPVSTDLKKPLAILLNPSGNRLYISEDTSNYRILVFDIK
jgi:DNA-binding beta-propeller fold protein YncE